MSEPTITYLGPASDAETAEGRTRSTAPEVVAVINEQGEYFKETVVDHRPGIDRLPVGTELVDRANVIRLQAERDALQQRLNAADQLADDLKKEIDHLKGDSHE